ncbi:hypothetical protein HMPREF1987_01615 [Peptostreptococcaceae bacterium oral taxon 113 str. W5053]|nr:hypothetical protein HMPREF1987_01615 [Peptostreptococcaceae bacterium oral taxon 113 str. W5053]
MTKSELIIKEIQDNIDSDDGDTFYIAEEGIPLYIGNQKATIAYCGSEIELEWKTTPPRGDEIYSGRLSLLGRELPFWLYGRNLIFLDAYYLLAETVEIGTWSPITSVLINIHTGKYASLEHWYNNILIEENGVKLKNDYDGSSRMLTDVGQLQWVKLE